MLEIGIKGNKKVIVDDTNTAEVYGSGDLPVFATPAMIGLKCIAKVSLWKLTAKGLCLT